MKYLRIPQLWLFGWMILFIPSCAQKVITVEPIAPKVSHLRASVDQTAKAAKKVDQSTKKLADSTQGEATMIDAGLAKAEELRTAKTVSQADLEANAKLWEELHTSNALILEAAKQTNLDAHEMTQAATDTSEEVVTVEKVAVATDANTETLKTNVAALSEDASAWRKLKWGLLALLVIGVICFFGFYVLPRIIKAAKPPGT